MPCTSNTRRLQPSKEQPKPKPGKIRKTLAYAAPHLALGVTPSSAILSRFLKGRKPGTGILPGMPAELLQTIVKFLPMPALGNLRLACKELETKTLWYFATTYFREMKFMHSKYALEALVAMSKSRMARYVQTLGLGPPSNDQSIVVFRGEEPKSSIARQQITTALYRYADENRTMRAFGQDAAMIQTAFENLSAVTKIQLLAPESECDCPGCSLKFSYDSDQSSLSSYGERYLTQSVGGGKAAFEATVLDSSQSLARILHVALSSAQAANLQLECVETCVTLCPPDYLAEFQLTGFAAYPLTFPSGPVGDVFDTAFAKLSTIGLFLGHHHDTCNKERRNQFVRRLLEFLARAPALRTLGLTLQEGYGKIDCLKQITQSAELRKIKQLELSNFDCVHTELSEILEPLKHTLGALHLDYVGIKDNLAMLKFFRDQMTTLNKVRLHCVMRYLHNIEYTGDAIGNYFDGAIERWTKVDAQVTSTGGVLYDVALLTDFI